MFIDLVIVTYPLSTEKHLCIAPKFSYLEQGDEVMVDNKKAGIVFDSITVTQDDEKFNFIANAMGANFPLPRITSKVTYSKMNWEET